MHIESLELSECDLMIAQMPHVHLAQWLYHIHIGYFWARDCIHISRNFRIQVVDDPVRSRSQYVVLSCLAESQKLIEMIRSHCATMKANSRPAVSWSSAWFITSVSFFSLFKKNHHWLYFEGIYQSLLMWWRAYWEIVWRRHYLAWSNKFCRSKDSCKHLSQQVEGLNFWMQLLFVYLLHVSL